MLCNSSGMAASTTVNPQVQAPGARRSSKGQQVATGSRWFTEGPEKTDRGVHLPATFTTPKAAGTYPALPLAPYTLERLGEFHWFAKALHTSAGMLRLQCTVGGSANQGLLGGDPCLQGPHAVLQYLVGSMLPGVQAERLRRSFAVPTHVIRDPCLLRRSPHSRSGLRRTATYAGQPGCLKDSTS